jgi:hypothetical protein
MDSSRRIGVFDGDLVELRDIVRLGVRLAAGVTSPSIGFSDASTFGSGSTISTDGIAVSVSGNSTVVATGALASFSDTGSWI